MHDTNPIHETHPLQKMLASPSPTDSEAHHREYLEPQVYNQINTTGSLFTFRSIQNELGNSLIQHSLGNGSFIELRNIN